MAEEDLGKPVEELFQHFEEIPAIPCIPQGILVPVWKGETFEVPPKGQELGIAMPAQEQPIASASIGQVHKAVETAERRQSNRSNSGLFPGNPSRWALSGSESAASTRCQADSSSHSAQLPAVATPR